MDVYDPPFEGSQKIPLQHPHETGQHNQIHFRFPQGIDVSAFGFFVEFGAEFSGGDEPSGNIPFAGMRENARSFNIAQNQRYARRDRSGGARIGNRHEIRAFARTQHADAEISVVRHGLYLQARDVELQAFACARNEGIT